MIRFFSPPNILGFTFLKRIYKGNLFSQLMQGTLCYIMMDQWRETVGHLRKWSLQYALPWFIDPCPGVSRKIFGKGALLLARVASDFLQSNIMFRIVHEHECTLSVILRGAKVHLKIFLSIVRDCLFTLCLEHKAGEIFMEGVFRVVYIKQ